MYAGLQLIEQETGLPPRFAEGLAWPLFAGPKRRDRGAERQARGIQLILGTLSPNIPRFQKSLDGGYRDLQLTVRVGKGLMCELQMNTKFFLYVKDGGNIDVSDSSCLHKIVRHDCPVLLPLRAGDQRPPCL